MQKMQRRALQHLIQRRSNVHLLLLNSTKRCLADDTSNNDKNKDLKLTTTKSVLQELNGVPKDVAKGPKPIRLPAQEEEKDAWVEFKRQVKTMASMTTVVPTPFQCEVLIIGGGIVGAFTAYWLKTIYKQINVVVVERDPNYTESSTFWSVGGFRQQFSLPENIRMSLFGSEFLHTAKETLKIDKDDIDLDVNHDGYLFLATKKTAQNMLANHKVQLSQGAKVRLLSADELKASFKWINTEDIELASFGYSNEGWVDPRKYLRAVRQKAESLGVHFKRGQLVDFEAEGFDSSPYSPTRKLHRALIDSYDGTLMPITFQNVVNAAGPWAGEVAKLAGIGVNYDDDDPNEMPIQSFSTALPVEPRKRYIYMFHAENGPLVNVPLTIDHTGVFFRRYGLTNHYLCGLNQDEASEPKNLSLDEIDYEYFSKRIKPVLMRRVPAFTNMKLVQAWAGYYDYNTFDQNLIIGPHHLHSNFIFANGSSGHGLQHAAAIGRSVAELIIYQKYETLNLSRFGFERIVHNIPVKEIDVV